MKDRYSKPETTHWTGRTSGSLAYLHEKVVLQNAMDASYSIATEKAFAILGYACDEGVRRNLGRPGAAKGPNAIRTQLGKLANHLPDKISFLDMGNVDCLDGDMEATQKALQKQVDAILRKNIFPLLLGGGHDMAYGHYCGIRDFLGGKQSLGIINFDAHFDLRDFVMGANSGTPFRQIADDCSKHDLPFQYLCLGIRKEANARELYKTADELGVTYMSQAEFAIQHIEQVERAIKTFLSRVDAVYVTIDLDGFSSAYAPGVSAASPMGFSPGIMLASLGHIIRSQKLISVDVAEMNPFYDKDDQTAKLAASLLHYIIHEVTLL
jgi:formiminoglutamase